jgi:hypothetical protein
LLLAISKLSEEHHEQGKHKTINETLNNPEIQEKGNSQKNHGFQL